MPLWTLSSFSRYFCALIGILYLHKLPFYENKLKPPDQDIIALTKLPIAALCLEPFSEHRKEIPDPSLAAMQDQLPLKLPG